MDERGLRPGHLLSLGGAAVAFIALWVPWYAVRVSDVLRDVVAAANDGPASSLTPFARRLAEVLPPEVHASAWKIYAGADIAIAAGAVIVGVLVLAAGETFGPSIRVHRDVAAQVAIWVGMAMALLVVWKLLHPSIPSKWAVPLAGPWLALAGAICMSAGGWAARTRP